MSFVRYIRRESCCSVLRIFCCVCSDSPVYCIVCAVIFEQCKCVIRNLGTLPDQLLQISYAIGAFNLYEPGGKVTGAIPILFVLYLSLYAVMLPGTYWAYRKAEVK